MSNSLTWKYYWCLSNALRRKHFIPCFKRYSLADTRSAAPPEDTNFFNFTKFFLHILTKNRGSLRFVSLVVETPGFVSDNTRLNLIVVLYFCWCHFAQVTTGNRRVPWWRRDVFPHQKISTRSTWRRGRPSSYARRSVTCPPCRAGRTITSKKSKYHAHRLRSLYTCIY